ncbi:MAG: TolC family protein [Lysobacteraceae bacterium]
MRFPALAALSVICLCLGACAALPVQQGREQVGEQLAQRQGSAVSQLPGQERLDEALHARLREPLTPDAAVSIAWANSPRVRRALAELDIAAADVFDSRQVRMPSLSWEAIEGGARSLGLGVALGDLIRLPARKRAGQALWRSAVTGTAALLLEEATAVREDYYRYQAAMQVADMRAAAAEAADLSAELARRFHAAGNIDALQLAREEAAASQAQDVLARARIARLETRMALAERLGLAGRTNRWQLPDRLRLPPDDAFDTTQLLARAGDERLDLQSARLTAEARGMSARSAQRLLGIDAAGLELERGRDGAARTNSAKLELDLPLFGQSRGGVVRARARQDLAELEVERIELDIERAVRGGVARLDGLREVIALHRDGLIPQREAIVARQQERYNYMLIGVFELLQAKQQEYDAYQGYLEAIRDYWLAHARLMQAVGGRLPEGAAAREAAPSIEDLLHDPDVGGYHHHGDAS